MPSRASMAENLPMKRELDSLWRGETAGNTCQLAHEPESYHRANNPRMTLPPFSDEHGPFPDEIEVVVGSIPGVCRSSRADRLPYQALTVDLLLLRPQRARRDWEPGPTRRMRRSEREILTIGQLEAKRFFGHSLAAFLRQRRWCAPRAHAAYAGYRLTPSAFGTGRTVRAGPYSSSARRLRARQATHYAVTVRHELVFSRFGIG